MAGQQLASIFGLFSIIFLSLIYYRASNSPKTANLNKDINEQTKLENEV